MILFCACTWSGLTSGSKSTSLWFRLNSANTSRFLGPLKSNDQNTSASEDATTYCTCKKFIPKILFRQSKIFQDNWRKITASDKTTKHSCYHMLWQFALPENGMFADDEIEPMRPRIDKTRQLSIHEYILSILHFKPDRLSTYTFPRFHCQAFVCC